MKVNDTLLVINETALPSMTEQKWSSVTFHRIPSPKYPFIYAFENLVLTSLGFHHGVIKSSKSEGKN